MKTKYILLAADDPNIPKSVRDIPGFMQTLPQVPVPSRKRRRRRYNDHDIQTGVVVGMGFDS